MELFRCNPTFFSRAMEPEEQPSEDIEGGGAVSDDMPLAEVAVEGSRKASGKVTKSSNDLKFTGD